ncbi:MAG: ATP-binding protein [Elainellaceae cyanobacterium]
MAKILIAEDERVVAWNIEEILQLIGHDVVAAVATAEDVVLHADRHRPDLVLMDIRLDGELDGISAARTIYDQYCIPSVYLTAHADEATFQRAMETSPFGYVLKPFRRNDLLLAIEVAIRRNHQEQAIRAAQEVQARTTQEGLASACWEDDKGQISESTQQVERQESSLAGWGDSTLVLDVQQQVKLQTAELERLLGYKTLLGLITQKLRNNFDKHHVIQFVVEEVVQLLSADFCNAVFYNVDDRHPTPVIVGAAGDRSQFSDFILSGEVQAVVHAQLTQQQRVEGCFWVTSADEEPVSEWFSVVLCPMVDDQGYVLGDILVARSPQRSFDTTDCDLLQQLADLCAIAIRQSHLGQSDAHSQEYEQLNDFKDNFLNAISHELRTPIASIRMATQMLELMLKPIDSVHTEHEQASKYMQILKQECQREAHLIENLLDVMRIYGKPILGAAYPVEIASLVDDVVQDYAARMDQSQQEFLITYPPDLPTLITVPSYLKRVLSELMENACKHTPAGEHIQVTIEAQANEMKLTVSHSGVLIPTSELSRLFNLFYQSPDQHAWKYGGTGLGLALAKSQTEKLGGSLSVETTHDDETRSWIRFVLLLPFSRDAD